jgi:hypothetical protein
MSLGRKPRSPRRLFSPALCLSSLALFIALGSTAFAGGAAVAKFVYKNNHLGTGAVDARVVGDRKLGVNELTSGAVEQLRASADFSSLEHVFNNVDVPPGALLHIDVVCPAGHVALAGGGLAGQFGDLTDSYPSDGLTGALGHSGWTVWVANASTSAVTSVEVYVTCAPSSDVPASRVDTGVPRDHRLHVFRP